ncbi:MAG: hypothetical protein PWP37_172 [Thermotogota bacterium]|nr:hypothetical protein [Thermotogota bacterium]MDK2863980.1 hypothetical protein [Thermotogota bacterium]
MKQTPDYDRVQERMKPGVITHFGFLGSDDRKLIDIILDDEITVRKLGLTHEKIADRLQYFYDKAKHAPGSWVVVDDSFSVFVDDTRGYLPCPFEHPGLFPKVNVTVVNRKTDEKITYSVLSIHLIREHGFYQGKGSPFRLEPRDIKRILEL